MVRAAVIHAADAPGPARRVTAAPRGGPVWGGVSCTATAEPTPIYQWIGYRRPVVQDAIARCLALGGTPTGITNSDQHGGS